MREIQIEKITEAVKQLFIRANYTLPEDIVTSLHQSIMKEKSFVCKNALCQICENLVAAKELDVPICQDTGLAVVFIEIGQDVHIVGGNLENAINQGVAKAYTEGYLRCSIVSDPLNRVNTNDNTPAIIHTKIVDGENVKITAAPKGFGSENMSRLKMFTPAASVEDIIEFILETVYIAGANPCPPIIVGVGIGGDFEKCAILAKQALIRTTASTEKYYRSLEKDILERINELGIGAQGFGGEITALNVNIEYAATHIAGLPVAVNMGCYVTRHAEAIL